MLVGKEDKNKILKNWSFIFPEKTFLGGRGERWGWTLQFFFQNAHSASRSLGHHDVDIHHNCLQNEVFTLFCHAFSMEKHHDLT